MSDWQGETIADLAGALTRRETTSVALTEWCLERIATLNPRLNAFITSGMRAWVGVTGAVFIARLS